MLNEFWYQYDSRNWVKNIGVIIYVISALDLIAIPILALVKGDDLFFSTLYSWLIILPAALAGVTVWISRINFMKYKRLGEDKYLGLHVFSSYLRTSGEATAAYLCMCGIGIFIASIIDPEYSDNVPELFSYLYAIPSAIIEVLTDLSIEDIVELLGKGLFVPIITNGLM
ncbi:MAG: hypothetical protein PHZ02_17495, partial [Desulfocapsaceae bacterium]|nr:hypothetical protein [Desulfocapsaceae bacterium]